jgi:diaminohydroxyphosphoribosylaminopyrimidine deaminase/5-amino-6-(5-phosphoribosylamino)uracil reductase
MQERYMHRALELARRGEGLTSPNPAVGAVLVRAGEVVGEGFHRFAGSAHAEVEAIEDAGSASVGSTLYVTLEPCNHQGRTGACTEAIISACVERVIFAIADPNPTVPGRGADRLRAAGIDVVSGVCTAESTYLNRFFLHHSVTGRPWVIAKFASSLDGKTATAIGESKWITGEKARVRAHELRALVDAVVVGAGTVIADDPELTVRNLNGGSTDSPISHPLRVVLDSQGRVPSDARVFDPELAGATMVFGTDAFPVSVAEKLQTQNVAIIRTQADRKNRVDPNALLDRLGTDGVQSVMIEGGSDVHGSFFDANLVDEVWAFLSTSVIGGATAMAAIGGSGIHHLADRFRMQNPQIETLDADILVRGIRSGWRAGE